MKKKRMLWQSALLAAAFAVVACGGREGGEPAATGGRTETAEEVVAEDTQAEEAAPSGEYDIERIKSIKHPTEADNDFLLDQYELVCAETQGLTDDERKSYLMKKGEEGKVLAFLIMGVENEKDLTAKQQERRVAIQQKYK